MGGLLSIMCLIGLYHSRWFIQNSMYGKGLTRLFGKELGFIVLRILFVLGIVGGFLLASPWFHS